MTRRFTKILAALALLVGLTIPLGMWGQTRASETFSYSVYTGQGTSGSGSACTATQNGVTIASTKAYGADAHVREYQGSDITISGPTITKIEITCTASGTSSNGPSKLGLPTGGAGSYSYSGYVGTWTGSESSITLHANAQARWTQIVVTYSSGGTTPTYTVTYDCNGGTSGCPENQTGITAGTSISLAAAPTKTDYAFNGWSDGNNTYQAGASYTVNGNVTMTAQWELDVDYLFYESFDDCNGTGGNDGQWSGTIASSTLTADNEDWTFANGNGANKCAKFGTGSKLGSAQTPSISYTGNATLTFKAAAWNGNSESTTLKISATSGTLSASTVTLLKGEWTNYTIDITGFTTSTQIKFEGNAASNSRFFLDEVMVVEAAPSTEPYITAEDVDLAYDAEEGTITYTINNPEDGGSLVASCNAEWIVVDNTPQTTSTGSIYFTCGANSNFYAHSATVTLTYTYSDSKATVTKDVTVTQALWPEANGSTAEYPIMVSEAIDAINEVGTVSNIYVGGIVSEILNSGNDYITFDMIDEAGNNYYLRAYHCVSTADVDISEVAEDDDVVVYGNLMLYTGNNSSIYEFASGCQLVSLTHPVVPTITVTPDVVNVGATPDDEDFIEGTLNITYENLTINDMSDFGIQYYDAEGEEIPTSNEPLWIEVLVAEQDPSVGEGYVVSYTILENDEEARTAYFKVFAFDADSEPVYSNLVTVNQAAPVVPPTPGTWVLTSLADLTEDDVFVIVGTDADDDTFALPYNGGTSAAPSATAITIVENAISGEPVAELQWNLSGNITDGYTFYPNGETETWLYCTNTNNGVRVGTNDNKTFKMDEDGYLVNVATSRVLSIYVNNGTPQDWRCYSNYNNNPVVISFYKKIETHTIQYSVNGVIIDALQQTSPTLVPSSLEEYESYVPNGYYFKGWIEGEEISLTQEEPNIISDIELYNPTADVTLKAVFAICDYDAINCSNYCTRAYPINGRLTNEITETDKAYYVDRGELGDQGAFVAYNDVVTINGALGNFDPNALSIQQGGELIVNNAVSVQMNEWVNGNSWCFIASPLIDEVPAENIGAFGSYSHQTYNTEDPKYNLYFYDEPTHWWRSYQNGIYAGFSIEPGTGYLYSVEQDGDQAFQYVGLIQPYVEDGIAIDLNYTATIDGEENPLAGWNLVGNPFPFTTTIDKSFYYVINNTITPAEEGTLVGPCTGAFVRAQTTGETVTFTKAENMGKSSSIGISVVGETMRGNSWANVDKAIVSFSGSQLEKFVFDADNAKLYIPQNGMDYAIVSTEAQGELPVNFRANKNGTFTLSMDAENMDMNYLHLIDNMTGMDVDLLQTPSYTFEAKVNDYESRFRLVFAANNEDGASTGSATFAFYSNGSWIINNAGEATLQVVDLTGRILSSETVNGSVSKTINAVPGVYMLRLINGDNVNVQKIVVR